MRDGEASSELKPFRFYGPTCDSLDQMPGPFWLPADIREGDYIEIGMLGAYGSTMATRFNGFHSSAAATVWPEAMPFAVAPRKRTVLREVSPASGEPMQSVLSLSASEGESPAEMSADSNIAGPALELK